MTTYAESLHVSLLRLLVETEYETGLSAEDVRDRLPDDGIFEPDLADVTAALDKLVTAGLASKSNQYIQTAEDEVWYKATATGREHFAQITFDPG